MIDWTIVGVIVGAVSGGVAVATWWINRRQLQAAEEAKRDAHRPRVHLASVDFSVYSNTPSGLLLSLRLVNLGAGAALGIRGYLHSEQRVRYESTPLAIDLDGHGTERILKLKAPYEVLGDDSSEVIARLWIECRDVIGRKWATAVQLRFRFGIGRTGLLVIGVPERRDLVCLGVDVLDHTETAMALDRLYLDSSRLRRNDEGIPWPPLWGKTAGSRATF